MHRQSQRSRSNRDGHSLSPAKSRKPEKLIDRSRRVNPVGVAFADNGTPVSSDLVTIVSGKALRLKITVLNTATNEDEVYYGQAGLIRGIRLNASPMVVNKTRAVDRGGRPARSPAIQPRYAATVMTALHNVITEENEEGNLETYLHSSVATADNRQKTIRNFAKAGLTRDKLASYIIRQANENEEGEVEWDCGHDVDWTTEKIDALTSVFTEKTRTFERVRGDFNVHVGQKIGMAIYRDFDIRKENLGVANIEDEEVDEIYGKKFDVNIYTGQVTRVCDDGLCFEHSINTFSGCSGAIIFLLDVGQPELSGVKEEDYGKAIAVHVGGAVLEEGLRSNFAFTIPEF